MQAHKLRARVDEQHEIRVSLPDVPAGQDVEVIVLAEIPAAAPEAGGPESGDPWEALRRRFAPTPLLGPVVFHEDPCAP